MLRPLVSCLAVLAFGSAPALAQSPTPLIAQSCAGCHGQNGAGKGGTPKLAGYDRAQFVKVWGEFRVNGRPASIMNRIARGYTDTEVAALADYFTQKP